MRISGERLKAKNVVLACKRPERRLLFLLENREPLNLLRAILLRPRHAMSLVWEVVPCAPQYAEASGAAANLKGRQPGCGECDLSEQDVGATHSELTFSA